MVEASKILNLSNAYDTVINFIFEMRNIQKGGSSLKCAVVMLYPNSQGERLYGYTDPQNLLLFVPSKLKAWLRPRIYYVNGLRTCYVSANSGKVLDLDAQEKISRAVKSSALVSWKHMRTWVDVKVEDCNTTYDMGLGDTEGTYLGTDYASHTHSVTTTTVMDVLKDKTNRVYILTGIACALLGSVVTAFMISAVWMLVLIIVVSIVR